jgi:hypothetical protein
VSSPWLISEQNDSPWYKYALPFCVLAAATPSRSSSGVGIHVPSWRLYQRHKRINGKSCQSFWLTLVCICTCPQSYCLNQK